MGFGSAVLLSLPLSSNSSFYTSLRVIRRYQTMSRHQNGEQPTIRGGPEATSPHIPIHQSSTNTNDNDHRLKPPVLGTVANAQSSGISLPQIAQVDDADGSAATPWKNRFQTLWHWKPKAARYDPDNPPEFTMWINILFGFVSCVLHINIECPTPNLTPSTRHHASPYPTCTTTKPS